MNRQSSRCSFLSVAELCQNPTALVPLEILVEREQIPQIIENKHILVEQREALEPVTVLRNQQVAGSIPAGGSSRFNKIRAIRASLESPVSLPKTDRIRISARLMPLPWSPSTETFNLPSHKMGLG